MTSDLYFNFHGAAGYQLHTDDPEAQEFFTAEYRHHLQETAFQGPTVRLNWRSGFPRFAGESFRAHSHKVLARWAYRIDFSQDTVTLDAVGNRYAVPMVHHMMVHPALRWLVSWKDTLMLHGAAVVRNGCSVILTGRGGAGKTTTSSMLLAEGGPAWQLHADDYVFLGAGPKAGLQSFAYMTRSHLYKDLLRWLPELKQKLSGLEFLRLLLYGNIREWTREGIKWPVRLPSERLWPGYSLAERAYPASVLLLRRAEVAVPRLAEVESLDEVVESLLEMNFYEARHFIRLVDLNPGGSPSSDWVEAWRGRERNLLKSYLSETEVQWLELPSMGGLDPELGRQLVQLLEPLLEREDES